MVWRVWTHSFVKSASCCVLVCCLFFYLVVNPLDWPISNCRPARTCLVGSTEVEDVSEIAAKHGVETYHLLAVVLSAPEYSERREAARLSWRKRDSLVTQFNKTYRYVFVCGKSSSKTVATSLRMEQRVEKDIVMVNMMDSYTCLTEKVLLAMKWAMENVKFNFLLKTDDDVFVDLAKLFLHLPPVAVKSYYMGRTFGGSQLPKIEVVRNCKSKWYVPYSAFKKKFYPPYNQGHGYLLSKDLVQICLQKAELEGRPLISVEDSFVGILLSKANITAEDNEHIHDRLKRVTCDDDQAFIIGGIKSPEALKKMMENMDGGRPLCSGIAL